MIIDTTLSSFQKRLDTEECFARSTIRRRYSRFPGGVYDSKQEHGEFRQLYIREFLERNGRDTDIDLVCTVVFWQNGEIVAVTGAESSTFDDNQNVSELLEL